MKNYSDSAGVIGFYSRVVSTHVQASPLFQSNNLAHLDSASCSCGMRIDWSIDMHSTARPNYISLTYACQRYAQRNTGMLARG